MESANCAVVSDSEQSARSHMTVKSEPVEPLNVKEEPEWVEAGGEAAAADGLYADRDVKYEVEIEPELVQEQNITFSVPNGLIKAEEDSSLLKPVCAVGASPESSPTCPGEKPRCTTIDKPQYHCVSSKQFTQPADLNRHMQTHSGRRSFSCDICEMKFTLNDTLTEHKRVHTREKPFSCTHCNIGFTKKSHLMQHILIGKKRYTCGLCGKPFTTKRYMKKHMHKHTSETILYVCNICNKKCNQEIDFTEHMRIHTGEKPYGCDECDECFTYANSLSAHKEQVHNNRKIETGANTSIIQGQATEQTKHLHVWQLSKETTVESLAAHVKEVLGSQGDVEIKQVKAKIKKDYEYTSFIITVLKEQYDKLSKPEVWPLNTEYAEWIWFRRPAIQTKKVNRPSGPWR